MSNRIQVLTVADGNWAPQIATTLRSVIDTTNNPDSIELLVGSISIPAEARERIQRSVPDHPITWIDVPLEWLAAIPESKSHKSLYARLHVFETLSSRLDRVIYIDSDMIVRAPIEQLWDVDLHGHVLAASRCLWGLWMGRGQWNVDELGIDGNLKYAQTGLQLIDLGRWRSQSVFEKCEGYIERFAEQIHLGDQEILNGVLNDDWLELPTRWNIYADSSFAVPELVNCAFSRTALEDARTNPGIIHFVGPVKPWLWSHPHRDGLLAVDIWEDTAMRTDYADWFTSERERGLADLAATRPRRRSLLRRMRKSIAVLVHG